MHVIMTITQKTLLHQRESKIPSCGFMTIFPKRLGIFYHFLHTYYMFVSTLGNKFLFNYLQL